MFGETYTPTEVTVIDRWQMCHTIARYAYAKGFDVDPHKVNRKFSIWKMWFGGGYPTGHLMKVTGVKYRNRSTMKQKGE